VAAAFVAQLALPSRTGRALRKAGSGLRSVRPRRREPAATTARPSSSTRLRSRAGLIAVGALLAVLGVATSQQLMPSSQSVLGGGASSAQDAMTYVRESEEAAAVIGVLSDGVTGAIGMLHSLGTSVNETFAGLTGPRVPSSPVPSAAQAYRNQFGHSLDEDLAQYESDVETWIVNWRAAYEKGEPWAVQLAR